MSVCAQSKAFSTVTECVGSESVSRCGTPLTWPDGTPKSFGNAFATTVKQKNDALTRAQLIEQFDLDPETGFIARKNRAPNEKLEGGYVRYFVNGKRYLGHRLMWLYVYGDFPVEDIDHINRNRSDNRICNLRLVSAAENKQNQNLYKNNSSGYRGVRIYKPSGKWVAVIKANCKRFHLGYFKTQDEAIAMYESARKKLHIAGVAV